MSDYSRATKSRVSGHSDTSRAESLFIEAVANPVVKKRNSALIADLPDAKKMRMFRGRVSADMVEHKVDTLIAIIADDGGDTGNFSFSANNREGSDLGCGTTGVRYEIKLGAATHGAIGLEMADSLFAQTGASVKKINSENRLRQKLSREDETAAREHFSRALEDFHSKISLYRGANLTSNWSNHVLTSYHSGINVAKDIKKSFDDKSGASTPRVVIIKHGSAYSSRWSIEVRSKIPHGSLWRYEGIAYTENNRVNVVFGNNDAQIRMTLNQKNSFYRTPEDKKNKTNGLGWGTGTNSLSWNLWVKSQ